MAHRCQRRRLASVVGFDGPAPWPSVRALVVLVASIALVWTRRAHGPRRANPGLLVAGLLGLIVGGGIGVPHAVEAGISIEAVAGVTALATGVLLIGVAAVTRLRGVGWFGRLLTVRMVLARHKVPRRVVFVDELLWNTAGKILRRSLAERCAPPAGAAS